VIIRLVSSGDARALEIRDHIVPLLRGRGTLDVQRDTVRLVELSVGSWLLRHWTPFNELHAGEASSPGYRHAIERQRNRPALPYGLDVWQGRKLLHLLWAEDDGAGTREFEVVSFVRGAWEEQALAL
jgi:hypothetical protein